MFMNYVKPERIITITRTLHLIVTYEQRKDVGILCAPWRASGPSRDWVVPLCKNPIEECRVSVSDSLIIELSPNLMIRHRRYLKVTPSVTLKRHSQALIAPVPLLFHTLMSDAETTALAIIFHFCNVLRARNNIFTSIYLSYLRDINYYFL